MTYGTIGTISAGTMRNEDLIVAFAAELERILGENGVTSDAYDMVTNAETDDASDILDELFDALDAEAPPYCYFGAHPDDGALYGFWVMMDSLNDDLRHDSRPVPSLNDEYRIVNDNYIVHVHVNDHGNVTLYEIDNNSTGAEIWSLV